MAFNPTESQTYALFAHPSNKKMIAEIEDKKGKIIKFEEAEIHPVPLNEKSKKIIKKISDFDWIIFTDVFAVDYFLRAVEGLEMDLFELDEVNVCALGESVSDRLRFVQLHADVIPTGLEAETVFNSIRDYVFDKEKLNKMKILIVKDDFKELELTDLLREEKCKVTQLPVYHLSFENDPEHSKKMALLLGGAVDEFIFQSVEEVVSLDHFLYPEPIAEIFEEIKAIARDGTTYQHLREHGMHPVLIGK